ERSGADAILQVQILYHSLSLISPSYPIGNWVFGFGRAYYASTPTLEIYSSLVHINTRTRRASPSILYSSTVPYSTQNDRLHLPKPNYLSTVRVHTVVVSA